jgi:TonB family protein
MRQMALPDRISVISEEGAVRRAAPIPVKVVEAPNGIVMLSVDVLRFLWLCCLIALVSCAATLSTTSGAQSADTIVPPVLMPGSEPMVSCPYPADAPKAGQQRTTAFRTVIDATGVPTEATILRSSGSDQLDAAALGCFARARFQPATRAGVPVPAPIDFSWTWDSGPQPKTCDSDDVVATEPRSSEKAASSLPGSDKKTATPPTSRRAVVCVCFNGSGEPTEPVIVESSKNRLLDAQAIDLAKKSLIQGRVGCSRLEFVFKKNESGGR